MINIVLKILATKDVKIMTSIVDSIFSIVIKNKSEAVVITDSRYSLTEYFSI